MRHLHPALKMLIGMLMAFSGALAGLFLPALIGRAAGYGSGSYEDYLFMWMVSIPAGIAVALMFAWRKLRSAPKRFETFDTDDG